MRPIDVQPVEADRLRLRILMVLDHAPDYRESFLRELGKSCDLTVVAQPCSSGGLIDPQKRTGYTYVEIPSQRFGPFRWQSGLRKVIAGSSWDALCIGLNVRHLARLVAFASIGKGRAKWIWHGHILGRYDFVALDWFRRQLLQRAAACLTYSHGQVRLIRRRLGVESKSFNNTEVTLSEFRNRVVGARDAGSNRELRLLYVGRCQMRKKLDRLVGLAQRRQDVRVRLIGPGMESLDIPPKLLESGRVEIYGRTVGSALDEHFDWADIVANPGHVGLLVMNAARHGKGIVIDSESEHAPEYWLAQEAAQPFINFGDSRKVDGFVQSVLEEPQVLTEWGGKLQEVAKSEYTIESMASVHLSVFQTVARAGQ